MSSKFILQQEDGTVANGNARGDGAVDFQTFRTSSYQVASGVRSVVLGGVKNVASGQYSLAHGENNQATDVGSIAIGLGNTATARGAVAIGGYNAGNDSTGVGSSITGGESNVASSTYSTISGGQSNTASTNTHATVVGGLSNTASGQYSVAGGYNNVASGTNAVTIGNGNTVSGGETSVALGRGNTISGWRSFAAGDENNVSGTSSTAVGRKLSISGNYAFSTGYFNYVYGEFGAAFGYYASASPYGAIVNANGRFQYDGDAQVVRLLARKEATLTTGATTKLSLDGTGITNLINFGFNSDRTVSMPVRITWSAGVNDPLTSGLTKGDCIGQTDQIMLKKLYGGNISIIGTTTTIASNSDATMSTCTMNYSVNGLGELILEFQAPTFGGGGDLNIRVLANIEATQCIVAPF